MAARTPRTTAPAESKKPERRGPRRHNYTTAWHSAVIRDRLHATGMSSWELADLLGVHEHEIDLEELPDQPLRVVYELARRLDIHPADLIHGTAELFARPSVRSRNMQAEPPAQFPDELLDRLGVQRPAPQPAGDGHDDALTVATALAHADRPLTADELGEVLHWDYDRTVETLDILRERPHSASPLMLRCMPPEHFTVTARLDVLPASAVNALVADHQLSDERKLRLRRQREPLTVEETAVLGAVIKQRQIKGDSAKIALNALVTAGLVHHDPATGKHTAEADVLYSLGCLPG